MIEMLSQIFLLLEHQQSASRNRYYCPTFSGTKPTTSIIKPETPVSALIRDSHQSFRPLLWKLEVPVEPITSSPLPRVRIAHFKFWRCWNLNRKIYAVLFSYLEVSYKICTIWKFPTTYNNNERIHHCILINTNSQCGYGVDTNFRQSLILLSLYTLYFKVNINSEIQLYRRLASGRKDVYVPILYI